MIMLVLMLFSIQAFSQLEVGPQIGLSASTQSDLGNIWNDQNLCCGINTGLLAHYQVNNWFALKSGIFYNQKGQKIEDANQTYHFDYLELPVKAEFSAPVQSGKAAKIFFATGPYVATQLKAELEENGLTKDLKDETKKTDTGLSFELGFQFPVAKQKLQVGLNYDMGLTKIYDNDDLRNKNLTLNIGFLF